MPRRVPYYPVLGTDSSQGRLEWKCWQVEGEKTLSWDAWFVYRSLCPATDMMSHNFRLHKKMKRDFRQWFAWLEEVAGVRVEGHAVPSLRAASLNNSAVHDGHRASYTISTFALLTMSCWAASGRHHGRNVDAGHNAVLSILSTLAPGITIEGCCVHDLVAQYRGRLCRQHPKQSLRPHSGVASIGWPHRRIEDARNRVIFDGMPAPVRRMRRSEDVVSGHSRRFLPPH